VFLLNCDVYSPMMIEESATQGKEKMLANLYDSEILSKKDYSFLVIDKSAKRN